MRSSAGDIRAYADARMARSAADMRRGAQRGAVGYGAL